LRVSFGRSMLAIGTGCAEMLCHAGRAQWAGRVYTSIAAKAIFDAPAATIFPARMAA